MVLCFFIDSSPHTVVLISQFSPFCFCREGFSVVKRLREWVIKKKNRGPGKNCTYILGSWEGGAATRLIILSQLFSLAPSFVYFSLKTLRFTFSNTLPWTASERECIQVTLGSHSIPLMSIRTISFSPAPSSTTLLSSAEVAPFNFWDSLNFCNMKQFAFYLCYPLHASFIHFRPSYQSKVQISFSFIKFRKYAVIIFLGYVITCEWICFLSWEGCSI